MCWGLPAAAGHRVSQADAAVQEPGARGPARARSGAGEARLLPQVQHPASPQALPTREPAASVRADRAKPKRTSALRCCTAQRLRRAVLETTCHILDERSQPAALALDGEALALLPKPPS